jgi:flagellar biogenesis protein FliO
MKQTTQPAAPAIPFKRDGGAGDAALASSGAGVLIVALIAIAAVLVVRRRLRIGLPPAGRQPMLQVLETQRLGPRALVSVVEFRGTEYLLAQSEHGVACIATVPAKEQA